MNDSKQALRQIQYQAKLQSQLDDLQSRHLLRQLTPLSAFGPMVRLENGQELINLASNDYLGISQHPHLIEAACKRIEQFGTGSGASRLVSGHSLAHQSLENRFARFKHAQSALLFPTGYMANLGVLTALAQKEDWVLADKLCHASLIDAARASASAGAMMRVFPHRGYDKLEHLLVKSRQDQQATDSTRFIVTDSVFSMDGDTADLKTLCDLADKYDAILIVDEAHATGVLGACGSGLCEQMGVQDRVDVVISTASKALGSLGGMVTANQTIIQTLINRARPLIYTTAAAPWQPAMIEAALDIVEQEPWRRERLQVFSKQLREALMGKKIFSDRASRGATISGNGEAEAIATPIIPMVVGEEASAIALSRHLRDAGFYAPAIRPPTVAPGSSRVRLSLRADLEAEHIERLMVALGSWQG